MSWHLIADELTDFIYLLLSSKEEIEKEQGEDSTTLLTKEHYLSILSDLFFGRFIRHATIIFVFLSKKLLSKYMRMISLCHTMATKIIIAVRNMAHLNLSPCQDLRRAYKIVLSNGQPGHHSWFPS